MKWFLIIVLFAIIKRGEPIKCDQRSTKNKEAQLKYDLLCEYDNTIRPVHSHKNRTDITLHMVLKDFDFDQESQKITLNTWMLLSWTDEHLVWNVDDYDKISKITEHSYNIWLPNVVSHNGDVSQVEDPCSDTLCGIEHDGTVQCILPCSYVALCEMDFRYWPFDRQNCTLKMGAWIAHGDEINYSSEKTTVFRYFHNQHNEYKLLYADVEKDEGLIETDKGNQSYPTITFYFVTERHASFEVALILCPVFVLLMITLIGLWLEPGCFERLIMSVTNLTLHFILMQQISYYIPKNGENVPKIVLFIRDSMLLCGFLLLETVIVRSIARFQSIVPNWIDFITNLIVNSLVGRYFVSNSLNEKITSNFADTLDDSITLVEENPTQSKDNLIWKSFAKLIDRLLFLIYVICYITMYFTLIPTHYTELPAMSSYTDISDSL